MNIRKLIKERVDIHIGQQDYTNRLKKHVAIEEMFQRTLEESETLPQNEKSRQEAILRINNQIWDTNPIHFKEAIDKSKHREVLTDYSVSELKQMKLFKVLDYDIGYALKKHNGSFSEIVSVFNNEPDIRDMGEILIKSAIQNGGCYLDHFDGFLSDLYSKLGFEEIGRGPYNPKYDKGGIIKSKYGEVDVVYRKYKSC